MKKILLSVIYIAIAFSSSAQTQIPNGDFENWTSFHECEEMDSLVGFFNIQELLYIDAKNKFGTGYCPDVPTQYKTTDKQSGNYALKLGPQYIDDEIYYNYVTLGPAKDFGGGIGISSEGIPFTGRPTKLTGYYKYTGGIESDELNIKVYGFNMNDEDYLFHGEFITSKDQTTYKKFELELDYSTTDLSNPLILEMAITVGNSTDGSINENTEAFIDNLVFEYDNTSTSTLNYNPISSINIYSLQKNINFSDDVSDVHIVDMVGAVKMQQALSTKTLNAALLNAGMYIVTYKYNDAYFSKKIILE